MLDIRDYDIALVERIKTFYPNTHWINRQAIPLKEIRDRKVLNGEDVCFPIITVRRTNCPIFSKEYNSWSRAKSGKSFYTGEAPSPAQQLQNIDPELADKIVMSGHTDALSVVNSTFELTYYIDVISLERDNFDTIMVELQENLFTIPYLGFYNLKSDGSQDKIIKGQGCHLLVEEVEDISDLENFDSGNALYRATITVKVNAYIYRKFKSKTIEQFSITYDNIEQFKTVDEFVEYSTINQLWKQLGFSCEGEFLESLKQFNSLEEILNYFNSRQNVDAKYKIGPDMITLYYEIPEGD